jgi:homocysteine S-methyltransferase
MAEHRRPLPEMCGHFFLTDGGIETALIVPEGQDLPPFAAFRFFGTHQGQTAGRKYFGTYGELALKHRSGLMLETATWQAIGAHRA